MVGGNTTTILHKSQFIRILRQLKQGMRQGRLTYTTDYENDIPEKEWNNQEGGRDREKKRERTLKPSVM